MNFSLDGIESLIELAFCEDDITNDLTTLCCGEGAERPVRADIVVKKESILAGAPVVEKIIEFAGKKNIVQPIRLSVLAKEGTLATSGSPWMILEGRSRDLLCLERVLMNFLIRMSGIATATRRIVAELEGTNCKVLHTRKTVPGHRTTDIYACLIGGAQPHRKSLGDAILVKENHLRTAKSFQHLFDGINEFRSKASFVEIEVTSLLELKHAIAGKPDRVLLDNFTLEDCEKAVNLFGSSVQLEASGNIDETNVKQYALTGVDFVSLGSITHSVRAADLSMLFHDKT
ncbi:MAG: carboxylating nicotinate-nucleotide diphosphorylase [Bacteriovoracia bacterium]